VVKEYDSGMIGTIGGGGYEEFGLYQDVQVRFCVAVGPITRTVGTLTQSVKGAGC